ncbi:RseA family anti-sigma factor [Vibrio sp. VB16]|uniref:RseA family anti-sigma factor n=1 Tax=Vibrio sp. VB16 TaxID=2785746 RepID=UPI0018A0709C|nr:RseA family anti-sigma factor [Vibrio sp. VB16]UGA55187.1 anti-sigma E factor [Vibrio sp. VB16]
MADKELLSALMDGEAVDEALIAELEQDVESQDTWKNYHLIGDVMRGEAPETANWNIAGSVAAALDAEPRHQPVVTPLIESQPTPAQARRRLPAWLTQIGQVGVAACVSLMVIVGVQQYGGSESTSIASKQLPVLQTIPFAGSVEPVSLTRDSVSAKQNNEAQQLTQQRTRINAMLQDYELQLRLSSEQSGVNGLEVDSVTE